ncbi:MAG: hypothetical protein JWO76_3191 [Nocardioides sp.]|nr:hypothetical protein [Nocardioides sp.]
MASSHKREPNARRRPKAALVAGPVALLATASVVSLGVLASSPAARDLVATREASSDIALTRDTVVSRSDSRVAAGRFQRALDVQTSAAATLKAIKSAHLHRWTGTVLNLWTGPDKEAEKVGEIESAKRVLVTGRTDADREEIVLDGESRWVTAGYLSEDKPVAAAAGLSSSPCPDSSTESGLTANAVLVYRSVCHAFPQITSYGGWDAHGEHASGRALDIMTSDVTLGNAIAAFLQSHASELHLYDVIWRQHIWTPERAGEGWRYMPSRGSTTANHYDHVHVSTY